MKNARQRGRQVSLWLHVLRLLGFAGGLCLLLLFFALLTVGLPENFSQEIQHRFRQQGVPLRFDSIRLSLHRGWVLSNVRLYSTSPDDLQPLLQTRKLYIWVWPTDWNHLSNTDWFVKIYTRDMALSLGHQWEEHLAPDNPFRTVDKLKTTFTAGPGRILIDRAYADWGGSRINLRGTLLPRPGDSSGHAKSLFRQMTDAVERIGQMQFETPPELYADFNINAAQPADCTVDAMLSIDGLVYRSCVMDQLAAHLRYRNRELHLSGLVRQDNTNRYLAVSGTFNTEQQTAVLSVTNTLPASDVLNFLPQAGSAFLTNEEIVLPDRLDLSAQFGPAPLKNLAEQFQIHIRSTQVIRNDLMLNPLACRILRDGDRLLITNIDAVANGGPLSGSAQINLASKIWKTTLRGQCDPAPVGTLTGGGLQKFISRLQFPSEQPQFEMTIIRPAPNTPLFVKGNVDAGNFSCSGIPIEKLQTSLVYSNRTLSLESLRVSRAKEKLQGSVQVDFQNHLSRLNITSSFPPGDIMQVLAPDKKTPFDLFDFIGPVYFSGKGTFDYGEENRHNLHGSFRGEQIGFGKLLFSQFNTDVHAEGSRLVFTNVSARLFDGLAEGQAEFDTRTIDGAAPYSLNTQFTDVNFKQLVRRYSTNNTERTEGLLSGKLRFHADAKAGFWASVSGAGRAEIRKGRLANVPLFGGFSRLIQSVFPAFSLFTLTSFDADFTLRDGAIHSTNAQVGGTLMSARGSGRWSPKSGLYFNVKAQPLGKSREDKAWYDVPAWASELLKKGTSPFFYFLEFQLTGPIGDPEWNFSNLPNEVTEVLRRSK